MSKINILDKSVFNKIAAGEVVERPSSVVKELIDNSIDAGATKISISILEGGIKNITVSDNGSGILPDDFDKVFLAHATSKVKTVEDLAKIGTLGFRGEALSSIGSVANVELSSKVKDELYGRKMLINGGEQSNIEEVGINNGTSISVSNLFFNVPARAKFLKTARSETTEISNLIARYILCNPTISFVYSADGKTIYQSTGTNLFDAIYVVYGKDTTNGIIKVDETNKSTGIRVSGYIGLPTFSKANRTYQTLSINGRYVNSSLVSTCVYNAYEHYLMKGQFPFYVLNLEIPLDKLDVNVHPSKMEVRFENSNQIYGCVYSAVSSALYNCDKITTVDFVGEFNEANSGVSFKPENIYDDANKIPQKVEIIANNEIKSQNIIKNNIEKNELIDKSKNDLLEILSNPKSSSNSNELRQSKSPVWEHLMSKTFEQTIISDEKVEKTEESEEITKQETKYKSKSQEFFDTSDVKFIGTVFATYLIVEKQNKVYVIDEHAGHERLLFERLVKQVDSRDVLKQKLLAPYTFDVNLQEYDFLESNLDKISALGFDIIPFGDKTFKVSAVPSILSDIDLKKFFGEILADLTNLKQLKQSDLIIDKLMQHSCKCAVRAGKILSAGEVNSLIEQMKEEQMQLQCPHGRPVVVEITKKDMEKWFKRIV